MTQYKVYYKDYADGMVPSTAYLTAKEALKEAGKWLEKGHSVQVVILV